MVVLIDIPAVPSKSAVPTPSPVSAIALAVAKAVAVPALPCHEPMIVVAVAAPVIVTPVLLVANLTALS